MHLNQKYFQINLLNKKKKLFKKIKIKKSNRI